MQLRELNCQALHIPFKHVFKHTSATRTQSHSLWVSATAGAHIGYGEGCPRTYVTGESLDSTQAFFQRHKTHWLQHIHSLSDLQHWIAQHPNAIDQNPAAWCAVELALLEVLAKTHAQSIEALLGLPELTGDSHYSAILGDSSRSIFQQQLAAYAQYGFTDFKLKLSGELEKDRQHLALIQQLDNPRIRLDANNHWAHASEVIEYITQLNSPLSALEEPVTAFDFKAMHEIMHTLKLPIIVDESVTQLSHLQQLAAHPGHWIINLRVSKMGGLLRSLALMQQAKIQKIPLIVGAFVGETSLLTRAAITVAQAAGSLCLAQEGAFGTHLLQHDICTNPIVFGHQGHVALADFAQRPGFGLNITPHSLASHAGDA